MFLDVGCGTYPCGDVNVDNFRKGGYNPQTGDQRKGEFMYPWEIPNFVAAEACHLPFKDGAFDVAYSSHTIEHLADPEAFVAELVRVSRGKVILRYPHAKGGGAKRPFHISYIDEDRVRRAAKAVGVKSEQFTRSLSFPFTDPFQRFFTARFLPYRVARGIERRLIRKGFIRGRPFEVEAWLRNPAPTKGCFVFFVVPVSDLEVYSNCFGASWNVTNPAFATHILNKDNSGLPHLYNTWIEAALDRGFHGWVAFCHQDFILRENLADRLKGKDCYSIYGVIGANIHSIYSVVGQIEATDGSKIGRRINDTYPVQTLDEQCLIVHTSLLKLGLRFDERFRFHFYGADLCLEAFKRGYDVHAIQVDCQHKSKTMSGSDYGSREYLESKRIFADKWRAFFPIRTTTATFERGV